MTTSITLFCPDCHTYIGPLPPACFCGWQRTASEHLALPGAALWRANVGGPVRGRAMRAGHLTLFGWGSRQAGGGVTAFHAMTGERIWEVKTGHAVEGGLALAQEKVLFGTLAFLNDHAEVRCHGLQDGALLWRKPVSAGVWGAPVVREERVYVGCEDGQVHCFDLRSGAPVAHWPVKLPVGRNWLTLAENSLYALTGQGHVFILDLFSGHKTEIAGLKEEVKAGLAQGQGRLFVGTINGRVFSIHPRERKSNLIREGCIRIVAAPFYESGVLYVGGFDHLLHALNINGGPDVWKQDCGGHSLASSPFVGNGLVFVGGNAGAVHAFDALDGTPIWEFPVKTTPPFTPVMGGPLCADGVVYIGAEDGSVYALPWHLGRYAWAAGHLARQEKQLEAARHFAVACELEEHDLRRKSEYAEAAIQHWKSGGKAALAARFRDSLLGQPADALAREYENAGILGKDASMLRRAAISYEEAGDRSGAQRCNQMAGQLSRAPYLSVQIVHLPPHWEAGEEGEAVFEIKNRGASAASNIRIRLAGNLTMRLWIDISGLLSHGESLEVAAKITPTGTGNLVIEPHYTDAVGGKWPPTLWQFPFEVATSATLHIEGDVGAVYIDQRMLKNKVKIRGDVGLLKVKSVTTEIIHIPHCSTCGTRLAPESSFCDKCGSPV